MLATWLAVEVEDAHRCSELSGEKFLFLVSPTLQVTQESRGLDDVLSSAADKGYNCSYCTSYSYGTSAQRIEEVRRAVRIKLASMVGHLKWSDVCIDAVARISARR